MGSWSETFCVRSADYAAASNDRSSVSGVAVKLGDTAIGWKSSTQKCVTTATYEAEYVALCDASKEALFTRAALAFLQPELSGIRVDIFGDNKGAKAIADNPSSTSRSKHIDVKPHFIRGLIRTEEVRILHIGTEEQHTDVLTKAPWRKKLMVHRAALMNFSWRHVLSAFSAFILFRVSWELYNCVLT